MEITTLNATKTKWVLDTAHSQIVFKVKHLMITNVKGEFRKFNAEITTMVKIRAHCNSPCGDRYLINLYKR